MSSGCAVDNEFLAKIPLFEAKSDRIPGLQPSYERKKVIREKGIKGEKAPDSEKEVLLAQLMTEYRTSPDTDMRREAVDAMAKIHHPKRDEYMKEALEDRDPFIRISVIEAAGKKTAGAKFNVQFTPLLIDRMKADSDKDVRISAMKVLSEQYQITRTTYIASAAGSVDKENSEQRNQLVQEFGNALYDKVPAIRYEAMASLHKITAEDYGKDINRWTQYVQYSKGESKEKPKERTFAEKLPAVSLPMFK
ncbi:hypothetical protein FACS189427_10250 [Planctomycetales bacterium]|nr:hypothetical protein FACS189427_10250 [Planctomycetales bacterium]